MIFASRMQAIGVERAHISGLSLGAATGLWLGGKYPERVKSLSLHSCWPKSDAFLKTVVEGWQSTAKGLNSVPEMIIQGILPWCFTPEFYSGNPEFMSLKELDSQNVVPKTLKKLASRLEERNQRSRWWPLL